MASASLATNCKPTLGYSSRGAACIALKEQGKTWGEIGRILNMRPKACSSLASKTKANWAKTERTITLENNVFIDLEREAHKRGMKGNELAELLLRTIIVDKLYDAILG